MIISIKIIKSKYGCGVNNFWKNFKKLLTLTWWHDILIELLIELSIKRNSKLIKISSWQANLIYVIIIVLIGCLISQQVDLWKLNKVSTNQMFCFNHDVIWSKTFAKSIRLITKIIESYSSSYIFYMRVWSWLRMNAGGVPNTCKSYALTQLIDGACTWLTMDHQWVADGWVTRRQPAPERGITFGNRC